LKLNIKFSAKIRNKKYKAQLKAKKLK